MAEQLLQVFKAFVGSQIDNEHDQIGTADERLRDRIEQVAGDWGRVDNLDHHIFPRHHSRCVIPRRKRVRSNFRSRTGEAGEQLALAGIRSAHEHHATRSLSCEPERGRFANTPLAMLLDVLFYAADLLFQIRLQAVGPFVLRDFAQHFLQTS